MKTTTRLMAIAGLTGSTLAATPTLERDAAWTMDVAHTRIGFSVKHFFTPVQGRFNDFEATVTFDPGDLDASSVRLRIPVVSVDTRNDRRDAHLQTEDFFDAERFPYITFESTRVRRVGSDAFEIDGDLTIRDVTRRVTVPVTRLGSRELDGPMSEAMGGLREVASFEGGLTIDRNDFGVGSGSWAATAVVGGTVEIQLAIETNR